MWRVREAADSIIPVSPESYETLIKGLKLEDADHHPKVGGYTAPHWKVFFSNHVNNEIRLVNFKIHFISRPTVEVLSDIRSEYLAYSANGSSEIKIRVLPWPVETANASQGLDRIG